MDSESSLLDTLENFAGVALRGGVRLDDRKCLFHGSG
jgi:hypothetical protein